MTNRTCAACEKPVTAKATRCRGCCLDQAHAQNVTHGECSLSYESPEHKTWRSMISRTGSKRDHDTKYWKDISLRMAPEWRGDEGFARFLAHIGRKPSPKHSVDRIDPSIGYIPGNVRWATTTEQARNRRDSTYLTVDGVYQHIEEWLKVSAVAKTSVRRRLAKGWSHKEALFTPSQQHAPSSRPPEGP